MRLLALALALLLVSPPALGDERDEAKEGPASVGVLDVRLANGGADKSTAALRRALVRGLRMYRVVVVEDQASLRNAARGAGVQARWTAGIAKAQGLLADGAAAYAKFDSATADTKLRQAADLFEANLPGMRSPDDLIRTYTLLAQVLFATNREPMAREVFRRVVQLKPDATLDPTQFPPRMVEFFASVKKEVLDSPLGAFKITSVPTGANVLLDGQPRGVTPLELMNLPTGVHTVVVQKNGFAPHAQPVNVSSFRQEIVGVDLQVDRHPNSHLFVLEPDEAGKLEPGLNEYLGAVASAADLDLLLMVVLSSQPGDVLRVQIRTLRAQGAKAGSVRTFDIPSPVPDAIDRVAESVLADAAAAGWISELSARRSVEFGGGALDETRKYRIQAGFTPGFALSSGAQNFPTGPGGGIRVGGMRRLSSRFVISVETGVETVFRERMILEDTSGNRIAGPDDAVTGVYTRIPLEIGTRFYAGVGNVAPFLSAGGGVHWGTLQFREPMPHDRITAPGALGWGAYAGAGLDYATSVERGYFVEGRMRAGGIGMDTATHRATGTTSVKNELPLEAGSGLEVSMTAGWLWVF